MIVTFFSNQMLWFSKQWLVVVSAKAKENSARSITVEEEISGNASIDRRSAHHTSLTVHHVESGRSGIVMACVGFLNSSWA